MFSILASVPVQSSTAVIPTVIEAESGFPLWVLMTWTAGLLFALWVIYVVVREWRNDPVEEAKKSESLSPAKVMGPIASAAHSVESLAPPA